MASSELSLSDRLKRAMYLNSVHPHFYVGDPDTYQRELSKLRMTTMKETVKDNLEELFRVLNMANKDPNLPRRSVMFNFLAKLYLEQFELGAEQKSKVTGRVLELVQTDEEFFTFIKYYTDISNKSKIPSSIEKIVRKFYDNKTPMELAESVSKSNGFKGWLHKDLIKLGHVKSETPLKNAVINYILTKKVSDKATDEELEVLQVLLKADELRRSKEPLNALPIIAAFNFTMEQVSTSLHQNGDVWSVAIQNMTIQQILPRLLKLYKLNLLKPNTTVSNHIIDLFTSLDKVKLSGVHPIEVFTYLKRLEKGGRPMDVKLVAHLQNDKKFSVEELNKAQTRIEAKPPHIIKALWRCFELACSNVIPTNKRYLVTIDVTADAKKFLCLGNKVLTLLEAAVAYAVVLLRVEKDVVLAAYKDDKIDIINVEKKVSFADLLSKVNPRSSAYSTLFAGVEWASTEKKHFDVFVSFIHNGHAQKVPKDKTVVKGWEPVIKYRSKVNLPNAKFVKFAPVQRDVVEIDPPVNILEIFGFDVYACKAAECFCKGTFC
ncbi:RNA-binding protein RO60-like [Anthonomus grandis grandis]|uniref:RNA-binding protein RO60-like n=1 Tax=Anthonomus grandis grandis TaxID=2921223 RepID=UPI002165112B|nr:RNA-binding protein RO60-like [Anthonomus grandis grandis]